MKKLLFTLNIQMFSMIEHTDVASLIPEGQIREIFQGVEKQSQVFKLLTRLPDMSSNRARIKVLDSLPVAYWQGSSTAFKKTTKQAWKDKYLYAEEIAVIVPIAEADLKDAEYDVWGQVKPKIVEAIAKMIDKVVLFGGSDKPATFPDSILTSAIAKGFRHIQGANEKLYDAINETMGLVEESGYDVTGLVAGPSIKKLFRSMTDTTGQLIVGDEISALPRAIVDNGAWDKTVATAIVGDFKQGVFSIRQDVEFKLLTEGVIQDPETKEIVYNLAQQDMVALRCTFRFAWQLPNPVNRLAENENARLPFAVLAPVGTSVEESADKGE